MTKTCLLALCFLAINALNAANEPVQKVASTIKEVTVYLSGASKQSGEITMQIYAATAQTIDINCLYFVSNAAWKPIYDLRSEGIDKPLTLVYKAGIQQNTGIDWSNIKIRPLSIFDCQGHGLRSIQPHACLCEHFF